MLRNVKGGTGTVEALTVVRLVPGETKFFDMFAKVTANLILRARLMVEILRLSSPPFSPYGDDVSR